MTASVIWTLALSLRGEYLDDEVGGSENYYQEILDAFDFIYSGGNLSKLREIIDGHMNENYSVKEQILFIKTLKQVLSEKDNKNNNPAIIYEPYYSIFKEYFFNFAKSHPKFMIQILIKDRIEDISLDEMMAVCILSQKRLNNLSIMDQSSQIQEIINVLQEHWEIHVTLKRWLDEIIKLANDDSIINKIELPEDCKYIRHAKSHIRTTPDFDNKIIHFRNYHPKKKEITWEKDLTYDDIVNHCLILLKWVYGFVFALKEVIISVYIDSIINYEPPTESE